MIDLLPHVLTRHWITLHGAAIVAGLAVYLAASHTLRQRRHPSAAIAWIVGLALLPYVTLPLYLMFGNRKVVDPRLLDKRAAPQTTTLPPMRRLAAALGLPDAAPYTQLQVHADGAQALQALLRVVDGARHTLDIATFILGRDPVSRALVRRIAARAHAGVRVRLLLDGVGYFVGGMPALGELRRSGVQVALFAPLTSALRGRTNLRNHRKVTLADGQWLWCGGRNLAGEYFDGDLTGSLPDMPPDQRPAWADLSFDLHGGVAAQALRQFELDWAFATQSPPPAAPTAAAAPPDGGSALAQLVPSGPDQLDDTFYTLLVSGCYTSRSRILATTPYFVPEAGLLLALTLAARRGVRVDLLLPKRSNHSLADIARNRALRELWRAGARIWLTPRMMHAKAVVIDDDLALVGSANLDERSLFLNYELMLAFHHPPDVARFTQWLEQQRAAAAAYDLRKPGLWREIAEGLVLWLAFQL